MSGMRHITDSLIVSNTHLDNTTQRNHNTTFVVNVKLYMDMIPLGYIALTLQSIVNEALKQTKSKR